MNYIKNTPVVCYVAIVTDGCFKGFSSSETVHFVAGIEDPTPKATLTGHQSEVTCVIVSAELGIVVSGSSGMHYTINMDFVFLLLRFYNYTCIFVFF